jgi:D-glycero-D-manno-heptose 1,7-bisphosphate phosphatase
VLSKALFLDLDGTVRKTTHPTAPCPNKVGEQEILPNVIDTLKAYQNEGYLIIGVSNQGGVGLGLLDEKTCKAISDETQQLCDYMFTKIYEAMAAPSEKHPWTKPSPGMILQAEKDFNIDLSRSIMVGDKESDLQAARNAGVGQFVYANIFFKR